VHERHEAWAGDIPANDQALWDWLARATGLDVVEVGWRPTVGNYLGRVNKPRILKAVREGTGEQAAHLIDHLKKGDMARETERLLADTGWLPPPCA
jgi:ParB family transcriptional regulator, chromosome partitioning protein